MTKNYFDPFQSTSKFQCQTVCENGLENSHHYLQSQKVMVKIIKASKMFCPEVLLRHDFWNFQNLHVYLGTQKQIFGILEQALFVQIFHAYFKTWTLEWVKCFKSGTQVVLVILFIKFFSWIMIIKRLFEFYWNLPKISSM